MNQPVPQRPLSGWVRAGPVLLLRSSPVAKARSVTVAGGKGWGGKRRRAVSGPSRLSVVAIGRRVGGRAFCLLGSAAVGEARRLAGSPPPRGWSGAGWGKALGGRGRWWLTEGDAAEAAPGRASFVLPAEATRPWEPCKRPASSVCGVGGDRAEPTWIWADSGSGEGEKRKRKRNFQDLRAPGSSGGRRSPN